MTYREATPKSCAVPDCGFPLVAGHAFCGPIHREAAEIHLKAMRVYLAAGVHQSQPMTDEIRDLFTQRCKDFEAALANVRTGEEYDLPW